MRFVNHTLDHWIGRAFSDGALRYFGLTETHLGEPVETDLLLREDCRVARAWRRRDGNLYRIEFRDEGVDDLINFIAGDVRLICVYGCKVETVVLFGAPVTSSADYIDAGSIKGKGVHNVFLGLLDGDALLDEVEEHLRAADLWEPVNRLKLGLALQMKVREPMQTLERVLDLVAKMSDDDERAMVMSLLVAYGMRRLSNEQQDEVRQRLEAVYPIVKDWFDAEVQGVINAKEAIARRMAHLMIRHGSSVSFTFELTGLSVNELRPIVMDELTRMSVREFDETFVHRPSGESGQWEDKAVRLEALRRWCIEHGVTPDDLSVEEARQFAGFGDGERS